MKLIGIRDGLHTTIGRLFDDDTVTRLTDATVFYADLDRWLPHARRLTRGDQARTGIEEVPAVRPAARVLCVGLNYKAHAEEASLPMPEYPSIFGRWTVSLAVGGTPVRVPPGEPGLDWEVELGVMVGRPLYQVDAATALDGVLGYAVFNDLSARTHQMHSRLWTLGKNADNSGAISPVVTADETGDPADGWQLFARVNGETMQQGVTSDMIFPVGHVLAYLSEVMTLNPGDLVMTGTPAGVGFTMDPPRFATSGNVVEVEIEKVGKVSTPVA